MGNWYWVTDEVEEAGCTPQLVAAGKAKLMLGISDAFGVRGRQVIAQLVQQLPPQTRLVTEGWLEQVRVLDRRIREVEERRGEILEVNEGLRRLMTLPGWGSLEQR